MGAPIFSLGRFEWPLPPPLSLPFPSSPHYSVDGLIGLLLPSPAINPPSAPPHMPSAPIPLLLLPRLLCGFGGGAAPHSRRGHFLDSQMPVFSWQCCYTRHRGA